MWTRCPSGSSEQDQERDHRDEQDKGNHDEAHRADRHLALDIRGKFALGYRPTFLALKGAEGRIEQGAERSTGDPSGRACASLNHTQTSRATVCHK